MKKNLSFLLNEKTRRLVFIVYHAGLFLILGLSVLFIGPLNINTNLFDILPASGVQRSLTAADNVLGERNGRQIVILSCSEDFHTAKSGAEEMYAALTSGGENNSGFEYISLWANEDQLLKFREYRHNYRFMLLDEADRKLLEGGGAQEIADDALLSVYSIFSTADLDTLDEDPFLLADRGMQKILTSPILTGGNLYPREDVLTVNHEGAWYVMLRLSLEPKSVSITNKDSIVKKIYAAGAQITESNPGLSFYYSGVPFHSYESSSSAQREISLISTCSLIVILLTFFYIFRSPVPVMVSFGALGLSLLTALCATLLLFRNVHILSFVFGTTLIGTCVDYSIQFFIHRMGLPNLNGMEVRSRIFRGVGMGYISTIICFLSLLFAPFDILKQFAVFLTAGLTSSFLSVICIFPDLWSRKKTKHLPPLLPKLSLRLPSIAGASGKLRITALLVIFLATVSVLFVNHGKIRVENRIGDLYKMPSSLAESEQVNARVINYGAAGWYFIVSGEDPEETLQNEEKLRVFLDDEMEKGNLGTYMATSLFIPSKKVQSESYEDAKNLIPLLEAQFEQLGFPKEEADNFRREFIESGGRFLLPEGEGFPWELTSNFWIGKTGGRYYSSVLPLHVNNEEQFRKIAAELENVYFINKVKDIGTELDKLTKIMLILFVAAFAVVMIVVRFMYPWKKTLRILTVPVMLVLVILAVLATADISLGFFTMAGLLLVFGLGLDYIFYGVEAEKEKYGASLAALAIFLSFATTALSFGALLLSSFIPVHIFGITVFSGLCTAYVTARLITPTGAAGGSENQRISGSSPDDESADPPAE